MTDDLLLVAQQIVDRAAGTEDLEAFVMHEREFYVKSYMGEVESVSSSEPRGAGVRVVNDGRQGYAYTTDMSQAGFDALVESARSNAAHSTPDEAVALPDAPDGYETIPGLVDDLQASVLPEDKVAFAIELEKATRGYDPRIRTVEEAVYSDSDAGVAIASSKGVSGTYRRTDAWCFSEAIATEGDETEVGFEFSLARGLGFLDVEDVARRAAEKALGTLGATKIASARMPVVFDPYVAGQFLGVIGGVLTAEAVQKGRSLFAGRIGEAVAAGSLDLVDDGRIEGAPGSAPWDAEGVPTQRTDVISSGELRSYLYDTISARREGRSSTGNASRASFKSLPGPSPTNLAFSDTGQSRDEVMISAGRALLVQDFHGVHSGVNPVSGDFSVGATGHLLEDGVPGRAVKEVTIAAPMLDILRGITAVADDRRWLPFGGSFGGATTLVAEMTVAGQ